jgi:hypothetical protein
MDTFRAFLVHRYCLTATLVSHHLLTVEKSTFVHAILFSDALFSDSIISYWSGLNGIGLAAKLGHGYEFLHVLLYQLVNH